VGDRADGDVERGRTDAAGSGETVSVTKYFYVISIMWSVGATPHNATVSGVVDVAEGVTQETVFKSLFADACEKYGAPPDRSAVRHYQLVRNEL
jgi:hypothetical protein